jgi:hypothetical protein
MKTTILSIVLLITLSTFSQDTILTQKQYPVKKNEYSFGPMYFLAYTFYFGYERYFNPLTGLSFSAGLTYNGQENDLLIGGMGEIALKSYFDVSNNQSNSVVYMYIGPLIKYQYLENRFTRSEQLYDDLTNNYERHTIKGSEYIAHISAGFLFGLKVYFNEQLSMEMGIGGAIKVPTEKSNNIDRIDNLLNYASSGVVPRANFNIGFRF